MENKLNNNSPILIMGMHRSGTGLIAKILELHNVFIGQYKQQDNESVFFLNINRWIMNSYSSSWSVPKSIVPDEGKFLKISNKVRHLLDSKYKFIFLGFSSLFFNNDISNLKQIWGFKDPRNVFTLPLWKNIYPESRTLIIVRHPIDVINSLINRNEIKHPFVWANLLKHILPFKSTSLFDDYKILNISDATLLCELYYKQINLIKKKYNDTLVIKYEDILLSPKQHIPIILDHFNIQYNKSTLNKSISLINPDRAYAYKKGKDVSSNNQISDLISYLDYNV